MAHVLEYFTHVASISASVSTVVASFLTLGAAGGMTMGVIPRAGPLRALVLGVSSKWSFLRPSFIESVRVKDIAALQTVLGKKSDSQYAIVTGPKGIGKTTLVNTVMAKHPGVLRVKVAPATTLDKIVDDSLRAVTGYANYVYLNNFRDTIRIVKWHKRFFSVPPTIVLRVSERGPTKEPAEVGGAVRSLTEDYGLRVLIDSSDSSLESMALNTRRQRLIQVGLMEREVLEQIPQFQELLEALRKGGVADLVWEVLGGNPADYHQLNSDWEEADRKNVVQVAEKFLLNELEKATGLLIDVQQANPLLRDNVYSRFRTEDSLPMSVREEFKLPSPDKILRLVKGADNKSVLVPSTPAMALALRYHVKGKTLSLDVVRQALARDSSSTKGNV